MKSFILLKRIGKETSNRNLDHCGIILTVPLAFSTAAQYYFRMRNSCCDVPADERTAGWIVVICYTDIFQLQGFCPVILCMYKVVILLYCTLNILCNLIVKQFEDSRLDEEYLIVKTRGGIEYFILD